MSLRVDDRSGRSRARSPGRGRDRSRSRSNVRAPEPPQAPARSTYDFAPSPAVSSATMPGAYDTTVTSPSYETRSPPSTGAERSGYFSPTTASPAGTYPPPPPPTRAPSYPPASSAPSYSPAQSAPSYPPPQGGHYPREGEGGWTMGDYKDFPPEERPGYQQPRQSYSSPPQDHSGYYPPETHYGERYPAYGETNSGHYSRHNSYDSYPPQPPQPPRSPQPPGAQQSYPYHTPEPATNDSRSQSYEYRYAQPPDKITYTSKPQGEQYGQYTQSTQERRPEQPQRSYSQSQYSEQARRSYSQSSYDQSANVVDVTPYDKQGHHRAGLTTARVSVEPRNGNGLHASSAAGLAPQMSLLSVGGASRPHAAGELPPPSPLLEAYRGTYQQMSPLPLAIRPADEDDLSDLEPLSPTVSRTGSRVSTITTETMTEKKEKRVKVYDPEDDAKHIGKALSRSKVDGDVINDILPLLTHDQIMLLRKEYKKQVKVQGKGVNLSKHFNAKLGGNFGKATYVTALGRWESEGYWANFFYQSHGSRRELLIESLMGRSNADIWNIKDEFKDKRYSDDLVKCMEKELKMDKFRTAVLLVMEERRQEEQDVYPTEYKNRDVEILHKALTAPKGGESTMLEIIVLRSDAHLRDVMKIYDLTYGEKFAHAALRKSNNLVGEVIAHILNGAINKPARDALLLRHALEDVAKKNKDDELRYELLISRLVRFHWDKLHMMRVKADYLKKYGKHLEQDIEAATKGDLSEFLCQLCQAK